MASCNGHQIAPVSVASLFREVSFEALPERRQVSPQKCDTSVTSLFRLSTMARFSELRHPFTRTLPAQRSGRRSWTNSRTSLACPTTMDWDSHSLWGDVRPALMPLL